MTSTVARTVHPDPPDAAMPLVFSHPAADEAATRATDGGSVGAKARHVLFTAPATVHANRPQR